MPVIGGLGLQRQRNLGEIISEAFNLFFSRWRDLAAIALPSVLLTITLSLVLLAINDDISKAFFNSRELQDRMDQQGSSFHLHVTPLSVLVLVVAVPISFVVYELVSGAMVAFIDRLDRGENATSTEALDAAQSRLGPLIGATLRATVIVVLLCVTIVGIPWAIARLVRWVFLSQAVMIEGLSGKEALEHSAMMVKGHWWSTLGRLLVTTLVVGIPAGIVSQAFSSALSGVPGTILSSSTGFITIPYGIIATTLIYFDLKTRKARHDSPSPD